MSDDFTNEPPRRARRGLMRQLGLLVVGGAVAVTGLAATGAKPAEAQGYPPLPPPQFERPPPPPPSQGYVWQPGHWRWNGYRYVWFGGRYVPAGPGYRHFVPGHWANRYGQWVWIPQHWN